MDNTATNATGGFNTLWMFKQLKQQFTKEQASVLTDSFAGFINHSLAVKRDVVEVGKEIQQLRNETKKDIAEVRKDIEQLGNETKKDIERLRGDTKKDLKEMEGRVETKIIKWVAGMLLAQSGLIAALVKLL